MKKSSLLYTIIVVLVLLPMAGCAPQIDVAGTDTAVAVEAGAQGTSEAVAAATAQKVLEEAEVHDAKLTEDAQATLEAEANAAATSTAMVEATAAFQATGTQTALNRSVTATARVIQKITETAEAQVQKTAAAQPMYDIVTKLNADGYIKSTEGEWTRLDYTFSESWAQLDWYRWWTTDLKMQNFVLRTDAFWNSASDTPNESGCGIVFRVKEDNDHYVTFLSMTGKAVLGEARDKRWRTIQETYVSGVTFPSGNAEIVVAVEEEWITVLLNGEKVLRDFSLAKREGELALTVLSGTNKSFGTSCRMENIDIWTLK